MAKQKRNNVQSTELPERDPWQAATWEGSRREQIRRNLKLSVQERLELLEQLSERAGTVVRSPADTSSPAETSRV